MTSPANQLVLIIFLIAHLAPLSAQVSSLAPSPGAIDSKEFVKQANSALDAQVGALVSAFESLPNSDLTGRVQIAMSIAGLDAMYFVQPEPADSVKAQIREEFRKKTEPLRTFWQTVVQKIREFEKGLVPKEIEEITAANPRSRFKLTGSLCSIPSECAECSEAEFRRMIEGEPALKGYNNVISVIIANAAHEDAFWPDYIPKLIALAERKKEPAEVLSYYGIILKAVNPKAAEQQRTMELKRYSELRANGMKGSDEELRAYAQKILRSSPKCGYFNEKVVQLVRTVLITPPTPPIGPVS